MAKCLDVLGVDEVIDAKGKKHDWRADITAALAKRQKRRRQLGQRRDHWMEGDPNLDHRLRADGPQLLPAERIVARVSGEWRVNSNNLNSVLFDLDNWVPHGQTSCPRHPRVYSPLALTLAIVPPLICSRASIKACVPLRP